MAAPTVKLLNPYVGPRAFGPEDERDGRKLYGRRRETRKLVELLIAERIVLLHSPSGAGKTSLIQTELKTALRKANFDVLPIIRVGSPPDENELGPDAARVNRYVLSTLLSLDDGLKKEERTPLVKLAQMTIEGYLSQLARKKDLEALGRLRARLAQPKVQVRIGQFKAWLKESGGERTFLSRGKKSRLRELLAFSELSDEEAIGKIAEERSPFLLTFDQFEEILTLDPADQEAKEEFFAQVSDVLRDSERWAIFSMREDFVAALDPYLDYIPTQLSTTFRLDLLDRQNALLAIQEPARDAGREFIDEAAQQLVENLSRMRIQRPDGSVVEVTGHYVEPAQLQVVCHRLWQQIDADRIERKHVVGKGDVDTALGDYYAEKVRDAATTPAKDGTLTRERLIREWFDKHLITEQGVRGQVQMGGGYSQGLKTEVIRHLVASYLVRAEDRRGSVWFELAHDRLINPIKANNKEWLEKHLRLLQRQAREWEARGKSDGLLLLGEDLCAEQQWAQENPEEVTSLEREFLEESRRAQEAIDDQKKKAKRFRSLALKSLGATAVATLLLFVAVGATIKSLSAARVAEGEKVKAQKARYDAEEAQKKADVLLDTAIVAQRGLERANMEAEEQKLIAQESAREAAAAQAVALREQQTAVEQAQRAKESEGEANLARGKAESASDEAVRQNLLAEDARKSLENLYRQREETIATLTRTEKELKETLAEKERLSVIATSRALAASAITRFDSGNEDDARRGTTDALEAMWQVLDSKDKMLSKDNLTALEKLLPASQLKMSFDDYPQVRDLAFDAAGNCISTVNTNGQAKVYNLPGKGCTNRAAPGKADDHVVASAEKDNQTVSSVAISPDGRVVVVGKSEGRLEKLLPAPTSPDKTRLSGHRHRVHTAVLSNSGKYLATSTELYSYRVTDLEERNKLWRRPRMPAWLGIALFRKHTRLMTAFAFSSDEELVVTADHKGMADVREVRSGKELLSLPDADAHTRPIVSVALSPDGKWLVTADDDRTVKLWDISAAKAKVKQKPKPTAKLISDHKVGHEDVVDDMLMVKLKDAAGEEKLVLATASRDRTVKMWDVQTGKELLTLPAHKGYVNALAFSPKSMLLATAGGDNFTRIWDASNVYALSGLRDRFKLIQNEVTDKYNTEGIVSGKGLGLEKFADDVWSIIRPTWTAADCQKYFKTPTCPEKFPHGKFATSPAEP